MVDGEKTRFWIPQRLAYDDKPGAPRGMLVFDIELLATVIGHAAGDRALLLLLGALLPSASRRDFHTVGRRKLGDQAESYAEWRKRGELIVDGQRLHSDRSDEVERQVRDPDAVPLGFEVRVDGLREPDGALSRGEIDVRANGTALFESDVQQGTDALEGLWLQDGAAFEGDARGRRLVIGEVSRKDARSSASAGSSTASRRPTSISPGCASTSSTTRIGTRMAMGNGASGCSAASWTT